MSAIDITTPRLLLITPTRSFYTAWREAHLGAGPAQTLSDFEPREPEALSEEAFDALLDRLAWLRSQGSHGISILDRQSRAQLGTLSLFDRVDGPSKNIFLGYHIFNQHWGQGFATEAVAGAKQIVFEDFDLHRIEALVEVDNTASTRVLEKNGFRLEGTAKRRLFRRGEWRDALIYALTAEEYEPPSY
jgi:ribosomal-protein-alanine N-acetyltransferase